MSPWFFWGLLSPALALTLLFMAWPFVSSFVLTFQQWRGFGVPRDTGLTNLKLLWEDPDFWGALWRTMVWTAGEVIICVGVGIALALAFYRKIRFSKTLKFLAFLPVILPPTFYALAWRYALDPTFGWMNSFLGAIDPAWDKAWLSDPNATLWIVIVVGGLQYAGIPMILMLSAFNDIPPELDEAAMLDGATGWKRFWHVTLPLSRGVLIAVVSLVMVGNFKNLDIVYALTEGGPGRSSDIFPTFIYREAFNFSNFGYGSAIGLVSTAIILAISLTYTRFFRPSGITKL